MTTTLSEGVKVPDVGSVNWAGDLEVNWNLLNGALANLSGNVKLDRDNTWTGEQSFTLPIVGSITGTASKAIADEDGTSIKTGYVNVAGNQTVTGQKTWSGNNTFKRTVTIAGQAGIWWDRKDYTSGILPASTLYYGFQNAYESGGSVFDRIRSYVTTTGTNLSEHVKYAWNNLTKYASVTLWISADGSDSEYKYNTSRVIPATNNTVSLGSSSYQWSSVYAQTYYGYTMYFESMSERVIRFQTNGSNNYKNYDTYIGTTYIQYDNTVAMHRSVGRRGDTTTGATINDVDTSFSFFKAHINYKSFDLVDAVKATNDGTENSLKPITTNATDLGTSTNKWKTLNGVNPGALSLPSSTYVEIDTTNWNLTGADNSYIPPEDGYLICASNTCTDVKVYDFTTRLGATSHSDTSRANYVYLPVRKNDNCIAGFVGTNPVARFYPMLGNV